MHKIHIKPLSVNECRQGKRYKTKKYHHYEQQMIALLPPINIPNSELYVTIEVGFASKRSDIDNIVKPFLDILQKKYSFDDSNVYGLSINKKIVKKGEEYILFDVYTKNNKKVQKSLKK